MRVGDQEYRVAVIILMMESEFAVTKLTLASLRNAIGSDRGVSVSILLNGSENSNVQSYFREIPNVRFYASRENLGISGGRNFLFQQPEVAGSDIIMLLDNDVFVPVDYIRGMCSFLVTREKPGIVGPSMGWAKSFRDVVDVDPEKLPGQHVRIKVPSVRSADIKEAWLSKPETGRLFHMGTRHWFWLYALASPSTWGRFYAFLKRRRIIDDVPYFMVKADPATLSAVRSGTKDVRVVNIAGAGQVFFTQLLTSIGMIEPAIFPGWFEDSEFSIRALRSGYTNYTSFDTWLIHGTDRRHGHRDHAWHTYIHCRGRTILVRRSIRNPLYRFLCLFELLVFIIVKEIRHNFKVKGQGFKSLKLGVKAWWSGLNVKLQSKAALTGPIRAAIDRARAARAKPLVTVVTPSFNQGQFITETLDCIANQTYRNIEHIVVDGGSTDNTLDILKRRAHSIKYLSERDNGQSDAINKGFRLAQGDIIGWLNSDDLYFSEDVIESVVDFFEANPQADVVYGRGDFVDHEKKFLREAYVHTDDTKLMFSFAWSVGILQPAVFFRRKLIEKMGPLDLDNHTCMDYEYWVRITHAGTKMHFLDKKLAMARYHEDMKSSGMRGKQIEDICSVNLKYYRFVHPRWINVYAKYVVTKNGQIIHAESEMEKEPEIAEQIKRFEHELFLVYNSNVDSVRNLMNTAYCDRNAAIAALDRHLPDWKTVLS